MQFSKASLANYGCKFVIYTDQDIHNSNEHSQTAAQGCVVGNSVLKLWSEAQIHVNVMWTKYELVTYYHEIVLKET